MTNFHDKLRDGYYANHGRYPSANEPDYKQGRAAYNLAKYNKEIEFRADLAAEYGLTDHPKEPLLFKLAWDRGHASGFADVDNAYSEMAELLK